MKNIHDKRSAAFSEKLMEKWGYKRDEEETLGEVEGEETAEVYEEQDVEGDMKKREIEKLASEAVKAVQGLVSAVGATVDDGGGATMSDISESISKRIIIREIEKFLNKGGE